MKMTRSTLPTRKTLADEMVDTMSHGLPYHNPETAADRNLRPRASNWRSSHAAPFAGI